MLVVVVVLLMMMMMRWWVGREVRRAADVSALRVFAMEG